MKNYTHTVQEDVEINPSLLSTGGRLSNKTRIPAY